MKLLEQAYMRGANFINLDCGHVRSFDSSIYDKLVRFPTEAITILDVVLTELYSEEYQYRSDFVDVSIVSRPFNLEDTSVMRDLNPADVDKLVSIKGMIIRRSVSWALVHAQEIAHGCASVLSRHWLLLSVCFLLSLCKRMLRPRPSARPSFPTFSVPTLSARHAKELRRWISSTAVLPNLQRSLSPSPSLSLRARHSLHSPSPHLSLSRSRPLALTLSPPPFPAFALFLPSPRS